MRHKTLRYALLTAMMIAGVIGIAAGTPPASAQSCPPAGCFLLALPDLRVTGVDADNLGNGTTRIEFWVKNEGTATANAWVHRVDIAGVGVWYTLAGSIAAGATRYYSFTITSPPAPPMYRSVQVCADATGQAFESDETDNCLQQSVQFDAIIQL